MAHRSFLPLFASITAALLLGLINTASCEKNQTDSLHRVEIKRTLVDNALWSNRYDIIAGLDDNIRFLASEDSEIAYAGFENTPFSRERVHQSLERFRALLLLSRSSQELWERMRSEFSLFRSVGADGKGTVRFTGYFQPVYQASRTRTSRYKYPIYRLPRSYPSWGSPHPTRVSLEGYDGTGGALRGYELAWLSSRWEAFMIHVQGSAILQLTDGSQMAVGFAAGTQYKFVGIGKDYLKKNKVAWGKLGDFFERYPEELNRYLAGNNRFIFFTENPQPLPMGSLGVPVIPERSIATDKSRLPPGALGLIRAKLPEKSGTGVKLVESTRLVLDQDSGSAIRGPGRADVFMGTGEEAQRKANWLSSAGELYYLILNQ